MDRGNQNEPSTIDEILREIEKKADTGEYLYRGEPEHYQEDPYYGKVSSNFYRVFLEDEEFDVETEHFDIESIQSEMLEAVKGFSRKPATEIERLAEIQHYGGKTNLIDFTTDYLVALFMACDGSHGENGRVILLKKEQINPYIEESYEPVNRVIAQKSVFVRHPDGFLSPNEDDVIDIPAMRKQPILRHLRNSHGISVETIYNDIHGFIKDQNIHLEVYKAHYIGLTREQRGDSENG
ncbi:FRG domain-containing protein [Candidatus Poribacteria bacterium]|nr:FRG domain-containing protein [Candidatus Poribacteria bacterium]MYA56000.1 FRG domain-containing protein [Candidatus Poribacteria bacterium]